MAKTTTEINLRLFDDTALTDSAYSSNDIQPFANLSDLKIPFQEPSNYATLELNQWALDGTKDLFPDDMNTLKFGYWSQTQSDINSLLNVMFNIDFSETHSTIGITIYFYDDDFATDITVKWYDAADQLIVERTFTNDRAVFFADESVVDYKRIEIIFNKTNKPIHYVKIKEIGFGADIIFQSTDIKKCTINEELNPLSDEISINTMYANVFMKDVDYIQSIYKVLQDQQQLIVTEYVNDVPINMGTFYLTTRENPNENTIIFNSEDLIGNLSNEPYLGGAISGTVETVIDSLMSSFGTTLYEISDELKNLNISGYIPICDYRRALQLIAFSVNAVVDCSRSDKIQIYRLPTTSPKIINKSQYFVGSTQKELEKITKVNLNIKSYTIGTGTREIYKVTHTAGTYRATFIQPFSNLSIQNGTIVASNVNYVDFTTTGGQVIITGTEYNESIQLFNVETPDVPSRIVQKAISFENTVIWDGQQNAQYLYDRLINLNQRDIRLILNDEKVGDFLNIDALYDKIIEGYLESLDINLTGGFIGTAKIVGVIK